VLTFPILGGRLLKAEKLYGYKAVTGFQSLEGGY